ncbi:biopolymer transport protein ExbD [Psychrobacter luti]|uniref:Biopolymer transport protein ExbD n=1 Tax=Psychrobacter luti TaxID=198481 RepID=A0A839TGQ1_9GAMM|nr:biopolymer transporter ExbD [Psychrobacter luti]MBB3107596.1 biopolymer transport protein ExbD [Psychrobacter luti]
MAFKLGDDDMVSMNEMNLIPLIDIMLVLMIIFLVTATVLNPAIPLQLPKTSAKMSEVPPKVIQVSIDKDAGIFWDDQPISMAELEKRFHEVSHVLAMPDTPAPTVRLRVDKESRYDTVAQVLAAASEAKLANIAFVTD